MLNAQEAIADRAITSNLFTQSFYFMRHGETDWNRLHIGQGQSDVPLNAQGIEQAYNAAALLQDKNIVSIITSPLKRAAKTADIISQALSRSVTVIDDLKEASWGIMEGQPKGDGAWIHAWRNGGILENAETFFEFTVRVKRGLQQALELPGPALIVSHGAVYWAIQESLALPFKDLPNCTPIFHEKSTEKPY